MSDTWTIPAYRLTDRGPYYIFITLRDGDMIPPGVQLAMPWAMMVDDLSKPRQLSFDDDVVFHTESAVSLESVDG